MDIIVNHFSLMSPWPWAPERRMLGLVDSLNFFLPCHRLVDKLSNNV